MGQDMTDAQTAAQAAHQLAMTNYFRAGHGERTRTRRALELAALNVLKADNEANRERREAAYAA